MAKFWLLLLTLVSTSLFGQSAKNFHFQTIVRNINGELVTNQNIGIRASLIHELDTAYQETFLVNSGYSGQLDLTIGKGNPINGTYQLLDWSKKAYHLLVELDLNGGDNYTIGFTQAINSVPYALSSSKTNGIPAVIAAKRDAMQSPKAGQVIFCTDCGSGEFQFFNGLKWLNANGQEVQKGPVLVQQLFIELESPYNVNRQLMDRSFPLKAVALPDSAADKSVKWSMADTTLATVDQFGVLHIKDTGIITVTATANDCGGAVATYTHEFRFVPLGANNPIGINVLGDTAIFIGDTKQLIAELDTSGEIDNMATWRALDSNIVSIDANGIFKAKAIGSTQIEVISSVNSTIKTLHPMHVRPLTKPVNFIPPSIFVEGYNLDSNAVLVQRHDTLGFPQIIATDYIDDTLAFTHQLYNLSFNPVSYDSNTLARYHLVVRTEDTFSNETIDTLSFIVGDWRAPVIRIEGGLENGDTFSGNNLNNFAFPTAYGLDENGDTLEVHIRAEGFDSTYSGVHVLEYTTLDSNGNQAIDSIVYYFYDSLAPKIFFYNGALSSGDTLQVDQGLEYALPRAYALDNGDTLEVQIIDGGFDTTTLGCYTILYGAQDLSGNADTATLIAKVRDITPPEIINKPELTKAIFAIGPDTIKVGQIRATDNVGIASYRLVDISDEGFWGTLYVTDSGEIYAADPLGSVFNYTYPLKLYVTDSSGLQDSTVFNLVQAKGSLRDIRVKQFEESHWVYLGRPFANPEKYSDKIKLNYSIGDTILFMTASGDAENSFDSIRFHPTTPGAGSTDFEIIDDGGSNYFLRLKNDFDTSAVKTYDLKLQVVSTNSNTMLVTNIPLDIELEVQSLAESNPELVELVPANTNLDTLKVKDIVLKSGTSLKKYACPLSFANGIMGDLADAMDQGIAALPIIPEGTTKANAKSLMIQLPAYFWLRRDNGLIRLNLKVPIKGKTLEIEYVSDSADGGNCYWIAQLDKLKPSKVSNRLRSLDNDTKAGIVVTTKSITEKSFECIKLPCLEVGQGAHVVAYGKPAPKQSSSEVGEALLQPTAFAVVSPLAAGYSDPNLKMTLGMKAEFTAEFNKELVKRMDLKSAAAQLAIKTAEKAVLAAQDKANAALAKLTGDKIKLVKIEALFNQAAKALNVQKAAFSSASKVLNSALSVYNDIITKDELCTPGICIAPCYYPGWCSGWGWGYPCLRSCGCKLRAPQICVPNPVQAALAATFGNSNVNPAKVVSQSARYALDKAQYVYDLRLRQLISIQNAIALAQKGLETAQQGVSLAQKGLAAAKIGNGDLGKLADYILKNAMNKSVSTSRIQFITTVSSVNNGTLTGTLKFDASILGLPKVAVETLNFSLSGNNINSAIEAVVNQLIDLIP